MFEDYGPKDQGVTKDVKMLFVTDVHVRDRPVSNRKELERYFQDINDKAQELEVDAIVTAGDYTDYDTPFWEGKHLDYAFEKLNAVGKPVYAIHGNHDRMENVVKSCDKFDNVDYVVGDHRKAGGYSFVAMGGEGPTDRPHTPGHHDNDIIRGWLDDGYKLAKESGSQGKDTIVVSHAPPKGTGYQRFRNNYESELRAFTDEVRPLLSLSGHTHAYGCEVRAYKDDFELFFDLDRKEVKLKKENGYRRTLDYEQLENGVKIDGEEIKLTKMDGGGYCIDMGSLQIRENRRDRETHVTFNEREWETTTYLNQNALKKGVFGYMRAREYDSGTHQLDIYGNVSPEQEAIDAIDGEDGDPAYELWG